VSFFSVDKQKYDLLQTRKNHEAFSTCSHGEAFRHKMLKFNLLHQFCISPDYDFNTSYCLIDKILLCLIFQLLPFLT